MRTLAELQERLKMYGEAEYVFLPNLGHIAWHYSTGENIELLFLQATLGYGPIMLIRMADVLLKRNEAPYHSIFAFRLGSNDVADRFYKRLGWHQQNLGQSIYRGDEAVVMWITWPDFLASVEPYRKYDKGAKE